VEALQLILWGVPPLVFLCFAGSAMMERPTESNARRVARSARIAGRIWKRTPLEHLEKLMKWRRVSAWTLMGFFVASGTVAAFGAGLALAGLVVPLTTAFAFMQVAVVSGLGLLAFAHLRWAPLLLVRVQALLEAEAATTNEPPSMRPPVA